MNSDTFRRATELFQEICDLPPEDQDRRVADLGPADEDVRKLVSELLASDRDADARASAHTPSSSGAERDGALAGSPSPSIQGYRIHEKIGEGGMGVVWRATQESTRRDVALKVFARRALGSSRSVARFEREVELAAMLEHPGIARLYESGTTDGDAPYYAMELIDGRELSAFLADAKLDDREVLRLFESLCRAVEHAHIRQVIHRDLKPSNVIVRKDGQPVVVDFGLAKSFDDDRAEESVSVDGQIVGTPAYMSPEQATGESKTLDTRTDVYSIGVLLFRSLSGSLPHATTGSTLEILRRVAEDEALSLAKARPGVDPDLAAIVAKALAKDRDERYSTAGELAADIARWLDGGAIEARARTTWYALRKTVRQHRTPIAVSFVVLIAGIVGVVSYVLSLRASRAETERWFYAHGIQLAGRAYEDRNLQEARDLAMQAPEHLRNWEWDYLSRQLTPSVPFGTGTRILGVAFSPDASLLAVGTGRRADDVDWAEIAFLRCSDYEVVRQIPVENSVDDVAFSPDGEEIWAGVREANLRRYRVTTGEILGEEPYHFVRSIVFSPDGRWVGLGTTRNGIRVVNRGAPDGVSVDVPPTARSSSISNASISFSADSSRLLLTYRVGDTGKSYAVVLDLESGRQLRHRETTSRFRSANLNSEGTMAILTQRGDLRVWNIETDEMSRIPNGTENCFAALDRDGTRVVSASREAVDVWDLSPSPSGSTRDPAGYRLEKLWTVLHSDDPFGVELHPNRAEALVFGKISGRIDVSEDPGSQMLSRHPEVEIGDLAPSIVSGPQGKRCAFFGSRGVEVLTIDDRSALWSYRRPVTRARAIAWSSDDSVIVSGWGTVFNQTASEHGAIVVHDARDGTILKERALNQRVFAVAINVPKGYLVCVSGPVRNFDRDAPPSMLSAHSLLDLSTVWEETVADRLIRGPSIRFSPAGDQFALEAEWTLRVWRTGTWDRLHSIDLENSLSLTSFDFHPSGRTLAAFVDGELVEIDTRSWAISRRLGRMDEKPPSMAYSPDGSRLAVAGRNGVRLRDMATGAPLLSLASGHTETVAFTPDGEWILTASNDDRGFRAWPRHDESRRSR